MSLFKKHVKGDVYCNECRFFLHDVLDYCHYPENCWEEEYAPWRTRHKITYTKKFPQKINKHNDCKWFLKKE